MVNDVRGLFLKINQVDLPYQVFDNLGDDESMEATQLDVLAPLPTSIAQPAEEFEPIEIEPEPEPERQYGARKVIASIRQRVFQGFSVPAAEGAKELVVEIPAAPEPEAAPVVVAEIEAPAAPATPAPIPPAAAPVTMFPTAKPAAEPKGVGLLRRYAPAQAVPAPATPAAAADGETRLKTLFARLGDKA